MLSIVISIVVARQFMAAAEELNRTKWVWALIGVAVFIGSQFLMGIILGLFFLSESELDSSSFVLNIGGLVLGIGVAFLVLYLMKINTSKKPKINEDSILDQLEDE